MLIKNRLRFLAVVTAVALLGALIVLVLGLQTMNDDNATAQRRYGYSVLLLQVKASAAATAASNCCLLMTSFSTSGL